MLDSMRKQKSSGSIALCPHYRVLSWIRLPKCLDKVNFPPSILVCRLSGHDSFYRFVPVTLKLIGETGNQLELFTTLLSTLHTRQLCCSCILNDLQWLSRPIDKVSNQIKSKPEMRDLAYSPLAPQCRPLADSSETNVLPPSKHR